MNLRGQHEYRLDDKDRITVPSGLRAAFAAGATIVAGVDPCIEIHPSGALEEADRQTLATVGRMSRDARRLRRLRFGDSEAADLDSAGRIRIPKHLLAHAGLAGVCTIVGAGDYLEIWNAEAWAAELGEVRAGAEELHERTALFEHAQQTPTAS